MQPTLVILAAGMGSRYGGLKQLDPVGPNQEVILDYSVYDAIQAGFKKIVFVIKKSIESLFVEKIGNVYQDKIQIEYVFQELDALPSSFKCPEGRVKPWGTGHAILVAKEKIQEPFAVINADDFYGKTAFQVMSEYLQTMAHESSEFCMVAYQLKNTLSDHGSVSRGVATIQNGHLVELNECGNVHREDGKIVFGKENQGILPNESPVSMNFWGFSPAIFDVLEKGFHTFLEEHLESEKGEFYITTSIDEEIQKNKIQVKILETNEQWIGVTFPEDKPIVVAKLQNIINQGIYPTPLFDERN